MQGNRLRPVGDEIPAFFGDQNAGQPAPAPPPQPSSLENAAMGVLLASLRTLSQRALVALGNLFVLAAGGSAFWLWLVTMPEPSIHQLVGLGLYGLLVLALVRLVLARR